MDSVDWATALNEVGVANVLLPLLVLTVPGLALARGLRRARKVSPPRRSAPLGAGRPRARRSGGGLPGAAASGEQPRQKKQKMSLQVLMAKGASILTMFAMAVAGCGMVPLGLVVYRVIASMHRYAPLIVGAILLALLLAGIVTMTLDLKDGKVDHPALWLAPAPIVAALMLAGPVVWDQITDQAGRTVQMVMNGDKNHKGGDDKAEKAKDNRDKKREARESRSSDDDE